MNEHPSDRRWRRGSIILVVVAASLIVAGVAGAGFWQFSGSPRFCGSCHIMEPYVEAWKASTHRTVACVQCHYPPGFRDTLWVKYQAMTQVAKWATRTYSSKPFAEVEDGSCLRSGCHARTELEGKGVRSFRRDTVFDHRQHLDPAKPGQQLRCTSCHAQIVVTTHFEVAESTCFICHFKGAKAGRTLTPIAGCTGCHQAPKGDIVVGSVRFNHEEMARRGVACEKCHLNVVEGAGEAPAERCLTCHNQPEKLQRYSDTPLIHAAHVAGHTIECTRCHTEIKHKLPPPIGTPTAKGPHAPCVPTTLAAVELGQ